MKREYDLRKAKRAHFKGLPPLSELGRHTKIRITIMLDQDLLQFFKEGAAQQGAQPYQTQINQALREYVSGRRYPESGNLLKDEGFIARLAERVTAYSSKARLRPRSARKARRR